jgi:hypothetical protein
LARVELPSSEHDIETDEAETNTTAHAAEAQLQHLNHVNLVETLYLDDFVKSLGGTPYASPNLTIMQDNPGKGLDSTLTSTSAGTTYRINERNAQISFPARGLNHEPAILSTEDLLSVNNNGPGSDILDLSFKSMIGASSSFSILPDFLDYFDLPSDYQTIGTNMGNTSELFDNFASASTPNSLRNVGMHVDYLDLEPDAIFDLKNVTSLPIMPAGGNNNSNAPQDPHSSTNQSQTVMTRKPIEPPQRRVPNAFNVLEGSNSSNTSDWPSNPRSYASQERTRSRNSETTIGPRARRKAFGDETVRQAAACTRKQSACIRCRLQKIGVSY